MHVPADLGAGPDRRPGVDHRPLADIGAEVDERRHQHHPRRDVGRAAHHRGRHGAEARRAPVVLGPALELRVDLVPPAAALRPAGLRRPCPAGGSRAAPPSSPTGSPSRPRPAAARRRGPPPCRAPRASSRSPPARRRRSAGVMLSRTSQAASTARSRLGVVEARHRAASPVRSGGIGPQAISRHGAGGNRAGGTATGKDLHDDDPERAAAPTSPTPARISRSSDRVPGHAADAAPELPPRLQRRGLPDPRRAPPGAPAARAAEDRDGAGRARHRLDRGDVRQRAASPTPRDRPARHPRRSRGSRAYYEEAREFARLCADPGAGDRQPRGRGLHRRRPGDHGGRQPRRGGGGRHLDQPQHRAAARAGAEPSTAPPTSASTSTTSPSARCTS